MPRYTKQNGDNVPDKLFYKSWYVIPVESDENTTPINEETYLIQPRVAEYIDLLEMHITTLGYELPKLPINLINNKHGEE